MEAIKYRWSGDHKTILDIGSNDVIVRIAIEEGLEAYKDSFRRICKKIYKGGEKGFMWQVGLDDTKKAIRELKELLDALDHPKEAVDQIGARTMASQLF
jgi:hypothetical protein